MRDHSRRLLFAGDSLTSPNVSCRDTIKICNGLSRDALGGLPHSEHVKTTPLGLQSLRVLIGILLCSLFIERSSAVETVFFDAAQMTNIVASGATSDTIRTEDYLFTVTRDKLFTGGIGLTNPIGRYIRVPWPTGLEAQAVTAGPSHSSARIDIKRADGQLFSISSLTFELLANTAGAGASIEIMPLLGGEDGLPNPLALDATGYATQHFSYQTPQLHDFDAYKITLYVDFALTSLVTQDAAPPKPSLEMAIVGSALELSWPADAAGYWLTSATNVSSPTWSTVTNRVTTNGGICSVQLPMTGAAKFFRLRK